MSATQIELMLPAIVAFSCPDETLNISAMDSLGVRLNGIWEENAGFQPVIFQFRLVSVSFSSFVTIILQTRFAELLDTSVNESMFTSWQMVKLEAPATSVRSRFRRPFACTRRVAVSFSTISWRSHPEPFQYSTFMRSSPEAFVMREFLITDAASSCTVSFLL